MKPLTFARPKSGAASITLRKWRRTDFRFVRIVRERVGVIAQRRNVHAVLFAQPANVVGLGLREIGDIDVAHAAVRPVLLRFRPAHHLDALVAFAAGECENFFKRQIAKNRG